MHKFYKLIIMAVILFAILLAVGTAYAILQNREPASQQSYDDARKNSTQSQPNKPVRVSDLGNFYTDGSTRKCTYSFDANNFTFDNTFYFDKNRSLANVTSTENGKSSTFNQLYVDGVSYSWEQGSNTGTKVNQTVEELKKIAEESMAEADETVQQENQEKVENTVITCEPWDADQSKFVVPADVTFKEITI